MSVKSLILVVAVCAQMVCYGQKNKPIENATLIWLTDGTKIVGEITELTAEFRKVKIITGDILTVKPEMIKRIYLSEEISIFKNSKYQYVSGYSMRASTSMSEGFGGGDLTFSKKFKEKIEIGFGLGIHSNTFYFTTPGAFHRVNVHSVPFFAQGRYIFNDGLRNFYAKARIGYANNYSNWETKWVKDGLMFEGAIGVTFATTKRKKYFVELGQYTSSAEGMAINRDANALSDIGFDVWFNSFNITFGIEIGK